MYKDNTKLCSFFDELYKDDLFIRIINNNKYYIKINNGVILTLISKTTKFLTKINKSKKIK